MNYTIRQFFALTVTLVVLVFLGAWFFDAQQPKALISGQIFTLHVADTPELRTQGLSGQESMPHDHGMLFLFEEDMMGTFWMNEMLFDLDFIWLDNNRVIDLHTNVPAPPHNDGQTEFITPSVSFNRVIELNAGIIDELGVQIGDTIIFENL